MEHENMPFNPRARKRSSARMPSAPITKRRIVGPETVAGLTTNPGAAPCLMVRIHADSDSRSAWKRYCARHDLYSTPEHSDHVACDGSADSVIALANVFRVSSSHGELAALVELSIFGSRFLISAEFLCPTRVMGCAGAGPEKVRSSGKVKTPKPGGASATKPNDYTRADTVGVLYGPYPSPCGPTLYATR